MQHTAGCIGPLSQEHSASLGSSLQLAEPEEILRLTNRKEELYREILGQTKISPLPGVIDWLSRLRQASIPCAIASSTPRRNIELVLNRLNLKDFFAVVIAAEDVVHGKPNPEVFLKAAARLDRPPGQAVVFEDAYVGIAAAHAAGMIAIAIATTHSENQLRGADLVVRRLDELSVEQVTKVLRTRKAESCLTTKGLGD